MRTINDKPTPTPEMLEAADILKRDADRSRAAKEESFQRCDTDGFLSQWAHGITAELNNRQEEILRDGGSATFRVLIDSKTGELVATQQVRFPHPVMHWQSTTKWKVHRDHQERLGRRWIPTGDKSRVQKTLGLEEALRWEPAYAKTTTAPGAKSTGLGGCANAYVGIFRRETHQEG